MLKILLFVPQTKKTSTVVTISAFRSTVMEFSSVKMMILVHQIKRASTAAMDSVKIQNVQWCSINAQKEMIVQLDLLLTAVMDFAHMKLAIQDKNANIIKNVQQRIKTIFTVAIMSVLITRSYVSLKFNLLTQLSLLDMLLPLNQC